MEDAFTELRNRRRFVRARCARQYSKREIAARLHEPFASERLHGGAVCRARFDRIAKHRFRAATTGPRQRILWLFFRAGADFIAPF